MDKYIGDLTNWTFDPGENAYEYETRCSGILYQFKIKMKLTANKGNYNRPNIQWNAYMNDDLICSSIVWNECLAECAKKAAELASAFAIKDIVAWTQFTSGSVNSWCYTLNVEPNKPVYFKIVERDVTYTFYWDKTMDSRWYELYIDDDLVYSNPRLNEVLELCEHIVKTYYTCEGLHL